MAFTRYYTAMSAMGDPGRRRHRGFFSHAFRIPRGIRKWHPSGLTKGLLLGGLTLPFGGAGLALGALRGGGGFAARAGLGLLRRGAGLARAARGGSRRDIAGEIERVAAQYGVDPNELGQLAADYGVLDDDGGSDDTMDDGSGDPSRRHPHRRAARSRRSRHDPGALRGRPDQAGPGGGLAELAKKLAGAAGGVDAIGGGGLVPDDGSLGRAAAGRGGRGRHNLVLLPGHRRRCRVSYDRNGQPYCAPRRMNVTNVHALNRSMRRVIGFEKLAAKATAHLRSMITKSHLGGVARSRGRKGHKSGCGCVACRHR